MACNFPFTTVSLYLFNLLTPSSGVSDTEMGLNIGGKVKLVNSGRMNVLGEPTLEINLKRSDSERETSLAATILKGFDTKIEKIENVSFIPSMEAASCIEIDPDDSSQ